MADAPQPGFGYDGIIEIGIHMSRKDIEKALGVLGPLFANPEILVIMVDGPSNVNIQRSGGKNEDTDIHLISDEEITTIIRDTLAVLGIALEDGKTLYETQITDDSRLVAVLPPSSLTGANLVIRKWIGNEIITWEQLLHWRAVSPEMRDLIQSAVDTKINILVAGGTGSGKTTLTNRIVDMIAPEKRVVAVERSHEFRFMHQRAIYLEAGADSNVSMKELLDAGSKLRPDLLVVGELHDTFIIPTLQIFANGYFGMATIHATNTENALSRLETMCLIANPGLGLENIRGMIVSAFRLITYQEYLPTKKRKITQLSELSGLQDGRYVLQPLTRYNLEKDAFESSGVNPSWAA